MNDGPKREMTLGEYVDRLPESHGARLEYTRLVRYLRHAIDATTVELGEQQNAEPWRTWLARWRRALPGEHDEGCNCARCMPEAPPTWPIGLSIKGSMNGTRTCEVNAKGAAPTVQMKPIQAGGVPGE